MKLKKLFIDGYRCLCDINILFEEDLTVIVGENDCGKSSIIDCIKLITSSKNVESDDFNYEKDEIVIKAETDDMIFEKRYSKEDENIVNSSPLLAIPKEEYINRIMEFLNTGSLDIEEENVIEQIKNLGRQFGQTVRSNTNISNLRDRLLEQLSEYDSENFKIENAQLPELNSIQLDGKHFENVSSFFKEVFLKERQTNIWNERINDEKSIVQFVRDKLGEYSEQIREQITEKGIKEKLKLYIKDLTDIRIQPEFEPKDLNFNAKVQFLENEREINIEKKGDGTKRRITMALLEYKKEEKINNEEDDIQLYLLDEPDTHLHVKAQLELFNILKEFSVNGRQVIISTHSPFIINAVKPKQIRLVYQPVSNVSKIKTLNENRDLSDIILRDLGIENTYLYFSKYILLVEGETEEAFIPKMYQKIHGITLKSDLIKIINVQGIKNIYGFSRAILELTNKENLYVLMDNDAQPETVELLDELELPEENTFIVGNREFEDSFSSEVIYEAWKKYIEDSGREIRDNSNWTIENIERLKNECTEDENKKFSSKLKTLSAGTKKFTKPIFGAALGDYCSEEQLPQPLKELLIKLSS